MCRCDPHFLLRASWCRRTHHWPIRDLEGERSERCTGRLSEADRLSGHHHGGDLGERVRSSRREGAREGWPDMHARPNSEPHIARQQRDQASQGHDPGKWRSVYRSLERRWQGHGDSGLIRCGSKWTCVGQSRWAGEVVCWQHRQWSTIYRSDWTRRNSRISDKALSQSPFNAKRPTGVVPVGRERLSV
jgi:hypothetical protein